MSYELDPAGLGVAKLTKAQLVTFIVTAIETVMECPRCPVPAGFFDIPVPDVRSG